MFNAFERMMALRYLRARRKEGFVSVIAGFSLAGIGLGVATLIIVMAVMNGFRQDLMSRIFGLNGHMGVYAMNGSLTDYEGGRAVVAGLDGVVSVTPIVEGQVMVNSQRGAPRGAVVRGARPEDLAQRETIADSIVAGSLDALQGQDAIMIGDRMAQAMGVWLGDKVTLISPKGKVTVIGTVPRVRSYTVRAVFSIGMSEYDLNYAFLPLEAAQLYFLKPDGVDHLEVVVENPDDVQSISDSLILSDFGQPVRFLDWRKTNQTFFNALQVERNVMFLILTLIILVAAFNIISGLIMLVKDKGRDIAILRTMGASRGAVMRIFFMAGAAVGVIGTATGFILGTLFCANIETIRQGLESLLGVELFNAEIYFLATMPAEMDPNEVVSVVLMALGLSFAATLYPAWRAAKTDPVEALRNE